MKRQINLAYVYYKRKPALKGTIFYKGHLYRVGCNIFTKISDIKLSYGLTEICSVFQPQNNATLKISAKCMMDSIACLKRQITVKYLTNVFLTSVLVH